LKGSDEFERDFFVSGPTNPGPDSLRTSATLLDRVRELDPDGWEEFYRRYRGMIINLAVEAGLSRDEAEDVAQEVFSSVSRNPPGPSPRPGSFRAWLKGLTHWRIIDRFRWRLPKGTVPLQTGNETDTGTAELIPDIDRLGKAWDQDWQRCLMDLAFSRLRQQAPVQHFQVFELSEKQGWPAARIARELELNIATIYVIRHRMKRLLQRELKALQDRWG
jgi:RNA polymerase sigma factor (sigma-70 family)